MIDAKELMLFNYVRQAHATTQVIGIGYKDDCICKDDNGNRSKCKYANIEPIPLTPELLEKCGFIHKGRIGSSEAFDMPLDGRYCDFNVMRVYLGKNDCNIHLSFDNNYYPQIIKIAHVHQLQNLFYALTGTHLTIQL